MSKDAQGQPQNTLVDLKSPAELIEKLKLSLPEGEGRGKDGLLATIQDVLQYSVNTWDQGFLDKLYASTNAVSLFKPKKEKWERRAINKDHRLA